MGGAAALYLHEAGLKVVAVADAAGALYHPDGLPVPALLDARDEFGEIDRSQVPLQVQRLPRKAVYRIGVDLMVPAAVSYAITADNAEAVKASLVVEAANAATTPEAEAILTAREIPVIPGFVANAGAVVWAWWLLFGRVDTDQVRTFTALRQVMLAKMAPLISAGDTERIPPRTTALQLADQQTGVYAIAEESGQVLVNTP